MAKPAASVLFSRAEDLRERNAGRDAMYDRLDKLYFLEDKKLPTEGGVQYVTMPYAQSVIDLVADLASQMELTIEIPAANESHDAEKDAEGLEEWFMAWLSMNGKKQQRNIVGEAAWLAAQRAQVIGKTVYLDRSLKKGDDDEYSVAGLPVSLQLRDPRNVYVADGPLGPRYVVERWERKAADVRAVYPGTLDPEIDDDTDVTWTEYWDEKYRVYFANGEPIRQKGGEVVAHGYGCIPYSFGNARTTPFREGSKRFRPVLVSVESLAGTIDTWFSILATAGLSSVTNAWAVYSDQYGGENGKPLDVTPNAKNYFSPQDKIQAIQRGSMPADFFQLGTLLFQAWQVNTFPFNLFGQSPGDIAGYAISLLSQAGRRVILPIWKAIEDMLAGAMLNCVVICKHKVAPLAGDSIPLMVSVDAASGRRRVKRSVRLNVAKVGDDFDLSVKLADPMPQDEASNLRMALEATKGGLISQETAARKYGIVTDPARELERMAAEAIFKQLAPLEGVKLAQERGYIPTEITIPPGFVATDAGLLLPQAMIDSLMAQRRQQAEMEQEMAQQGQMQQPQMPPQAGPMEPMQAPGMQQPGQMGPGGGQLNVADLQSLAGTANDDPNLRGLAGLPSNLPPNKQ